MQELILIIHMLAAICIVILVLLQHGKGADAGAGFGSGASGTVFGSQGSTPFLMKLTMLFAVVFFVTSLSLAYVAAHTTKSQVNPQVESILGGDTKSPASSPTINKATPMIIQKKSGVASKKSQQPTK